MCAYNLHVKVELFIKYNFGNQCNCFCLFDQNSTWEDLQNSQLPLLASTTGVDTLPTLCLCDSHAYLTYTAALTLGMPKLAMAWWVLSSHCELSQWETPCRSNYTGMAVPIAVQLMLLRRSGVNSLHMKQLYNGITVLLHWAGCGFNCPCTGKD